MFLHKNDQKMTTFHYFGPRILFVRPERTVGNNGLKPFNTQIFVFEYFMKKSTGFLVLITKWAFQVAGYLNLRFY